MASDGRPQQAILNLPDSGFPDEFEGTVQFVQPEPPRVVSSAHNTDFAPHKVVCRQGYDLVFIDGILPDGETSFIMRSQGNSSSTIAMVDRAKTLSVSTAVSYQQGEWAVGGAATAESYGHPDHHKYLDGLIYVTIDMTECTMAIANPEIVPKEAPIIVKGFPANAQLCMTVCSGGQFTLVYQDYALPPK